jgi:hypothetical protein
LAVALASCDEPPPDYLVQNIILRLIPDTTNVGPAGGNIFVLIELSGKIPTDNLRLSGIVPANRSIAIFTDTTDGEMRPLPGVGVCSNVGNVVEPIAGSGDGGNGDGGAPPQQSLADAAASTGSLGIPYASLINDDVRNAHEVGAVVEVPAGGTDVLVTAAAYAFDGALTECPSASRQLVAEAVLRIQRQPPDAAAPSPRGMDASVPSIDASQSD